MSYLTYPRADAIYVVNVCGLLIYRDQRYQRNIIFLISRAVFNSGKKVAIVLSVNILDLISGGTMIHTSFFLLIN